MAKKYLNYGGLTLYDDKLKAFTKVVFKEIRKGNVLEALEVYQGVDSAGLVPVSAQPIAVIPLTDGAHVESGEIRIVEATEMTPERAYIDLYYNDSMTGNPNVSIDISNIIRDINALKDQMEVLTGPEGTEGSVLNLIKVHAKDADYGIGPTGKREIYVGEQSILITNAQADALESGETLVIGDFTIEKTPETLDNYTVTYDGEVLTTAATISNEIVGMVTLKEAIDKLRADSLKDYTVNLVTETGTGSVLKTYVLSQGGTEVGKIEIPKDLILDSAENVWYETDPEGGYIEKPSGDHVDELPEGVEVDTKYVVLWFNVPGEDPQPVYIETADLIDTSALDDRIAAIERAIGKKDGELVSVADRINDEAKDADYKQEEVNQYTYTNDEVTYVYTDKDIEEGKTPDDIIGSDGSKLSDVVGDSVTLTELIPECVTSPTIVNITIKEALDRIENKVDDFIAITNEEIIGLFS